MKPTISAIITTYNEAHNVTKALESLNWVDEIIVMDSFSTDDTLAIAAKYKAQIYQHTYDYPAAQKNRAITKASCDWILLLDADEILSKDLILEIQTLLQNKSNDTEAYWIYRKNYFMNQEIKHSGWAGDKVVRLFRKSCRYKDERVHEEIDLKNKKVAYLKNKIIHNTYKDLTHFTEKIVRYASYKATEYKQKKINPSSYNMYIKPLIRLVKQYIFKAGFLDGKVGWIVSYLGAYEVFMRYALLKEMYENERNN